MKYTYGVWVGEFEDNDTPDYYTNRDKAFDAWQALADTLDEGESAYMQAFTESGEVAEDFAHELRREGGELGEYYSGERLWV